MKIGPRYLLLGLCVTLIGASPAREKVSSVWSESPAAASQAISAFAAENGWPALFPGGGAAVRVWRGRAGRLRAGLVLDLPIPGLPGRHPSPLDLQSARADRAGLSGIQTPARDRRAVHRPEQRGRAAVPPAGPLRRRGRLADRVRRDGPRAGQDIEFRGHRLPPRRGYGALLRVRQGCGRRRQDGAPGGAVGRWGADPRRPGLLPRLRAVPRARRSIHRKKAQGGRRPRSGREPGRRREQQWFHGSRRLVDE